MVALRRSNASVTPDTDGHPANSDKTYLEKICFLPRLDMLFSTDMFDLWLDRIAVYHSLRRCFLVPWVMFTFVDGAV